MIIDLIKERLRPSSPLTIELVLVAVLIVLYLRPSSRRGRQLLLGVVAGFWLVSTPIGANVLVWGLARSFDQIHTRDEARGSTAVVVLGGGAATFSAAGQVIGVLGSQSLMRALEGARVAKLIDATVVIASGGEPRPERQLKPESEMIRAALVQAGVPADRVVEESSSKTTREQARLIPALLKARGIDRFVLVTSPVHMSRSLALFRALGYDPVPSVSLMRSAHLPPPPLFVPSDDSLRTSDDAIYDYAAWVYYWWNGWLRPAAR